MGDSPVLICATGDKTLQNPGSYVLDSSCSSSHRLCSGTMPFQTPFPGANTTCQGSCQGLQRKAKALCFTISPSSWHKGMKTLGVMDGDKGQGHNEHHIQTSTKQVPFPWPPEHLQLRAERVAVPRDVAMSPVWPCSKVTEHRGWQGGRTWPQP
ncbi:hypothetical protein Nmel_014728 [Mimus melanotis]